VAHLLRQIWSVELYRNSSENRNDIHSYCKHATQKHNSSYYTRTVLTNVFQDDISFVQIQYCADPPYTHTHTRLTALCPGLPRWAGTRKVKSIWILLKQETVSGSGISWAICKSAPRSRQITCHNPTTQFFTGRMPPWDQQHQSTESIWYKLLIQEIFHTQKQTNKHPFNGPLSRTTWLNRYQKGKTNLDFHYRAMLCIRGTSYGPVSVCHKSEFY